MELKNKNIINLMNPAEINNQSLVLFMYSFLPAAFVARTLEGTLIYLLLTFIFLLLTFLVSKLVNLTVDNNLKNVILPIMMIAVATLVGLLSKSFFVNFSKDYLVYVYLMAVSATPYMLDADNKEKNFNNGLLNTLQTFLGFAIVMIIIAFLRELLGTGALTFGFYINVSFKFSLFENYALTILQNPLGSLMILGFLMTIVNRRRVES